MNIALTKQKVVVAKPKKRFLAFTGFFSVMLVFFILFLRWADEAQQKIDAIEEKVLFYSDLGRTEQTYLASTVLPNGAIAYPPSDDGKNDVIPYFSDTAAMGLLKDFNDDYSPLVKDYINWHFESQIGEGEDAGIIYDFDIILEEGEVIEQTSSGEYDSVDSYCATFIILLEEYAKVTGDYEFLRENKKKIDQVLEAMLAQQKENGLTVVSPKNDTQYTFDNVEVSRALKSAVWLYTNVFSAGEYELQVLEGALSAHGAEFDALLYDDVSGLYYAGLDGDGDYLDFGGIEEFYPTAVAQLSAILFEVIEEDSDKATKLYSDFCEEYAWEDMEHLTSGHASFYWALTAATGAKMKDEQRVRQYMEYYSENVAVDHKYPLYCADAGWVSIACDTMIKSYEEELDEIDPFGLLH